MKVQYFKDKIYCGVNKYIPYYYAAIVRAINGIERKGHDVMFSVSVEDGIKRISNAFRYPSAECVEITAAEFKEAAKKTLEQMFNKFNIIENE
jgi:hypothetical protein